MSERTITVIPATNAGSLPQIQSIARKKRVAAYARVSTDKEEQQNSYEAQVDYYTDYIQKNPEWAFIEVYADEGITGTSTKKREGFNRMISDALAGKIDLILTKSVSRFARNTVDSLTTVRQLKEKGVEVYFEKENIYTLDSKGELLITIMSSLAQEEARSISMNTSWGKRKSFADGKVSFAYSSFLGYEMAHDGKLKIIKEEAEVVRRIYNEFLTGKTPYDIAQRLTGDGIPTPMKKTVWQSSTIESILRNEKYRGDAILQKSFTLDFLTKKTKKNEGEYPQYLVERNHPAIIAPETFEMVQEEFRRRKAAGAYTCISPFSGRIVCGDCGGFYGRKVWHSKSSYQSFVWHCNNKFQKRKYCDTPSVREEAIEKCFVDAFNSILSKKDEIAENYELCLDAIADDSAYVHRRNEVDKACEELFVLISDLLHKSSRSAENLSEVNKQHEEYIARHDVLQKEKQKLNSKIAMCAAKRVQVQGFLQLLKKQNTVLTKFDPLVWQAAVHYMVINHDLSVKFVFRDGTELPWKIEPGVRRYTKRKQADDTSATLE